MQINFFKGNYIQKNKRRVFLNFLALCIGIFIEGANSAIKKYVCLKNKTWLLDSSLDCMHCFSSTCFPKKESRRRGMMMMMILLSYKKTSKFFYSCKVV